MSSRPWTSETPKATPVSADRFLILDSADSNVNKLITIGSIPTEFTGAWTATHNANGQTLDNVGTLVSNTANSFDIGTIRLGNNESIAWSFADNSTSASLTLNAQDMFSFGRDITMNGRHIEDVNNIRSNTLNVAGNGFLRLAHTDAISWRNNDNDGNHQIKFVSDALVFDFNGTNTYSFGADGVNWSGNSITNLGRTAFNQGSLTYNATQNFDFDANEYRQITLTGDLTTLTTSNRAAGKVMSIIVIGDAVDRNISFNTSWHHNPSDPSIVISAGARVIMSFYCAGTAETDVIVAVSQFE